LVLVDDGVILGLQDRIRGLLLKLAAMQQESQYQVCCQPAPVQVKSSSSSIKHCLAVYYLLAAKTYAAATEIFRPGCDGPQMMRQTQALKESLSMSSSRVSALTGELEQLRTELEHCRQKAVTDQEQARQHVHDGSSLLGCHEDSAVCVRTHMCCTA
jgi:hypothetical protein